MEFRYHPIIEGLKISEDGSLVLLNGVELVPYENDKTRNNPTIKVNFNNKAHSVTRLVCEAWNGMPEHSGLRASKVNSLASNHYSNLEWKLGAKNGVGCFKQKLSSENIDEIIDLLNQKKPHSEIAKIYDVNQSTIFRINQKYVKKDK